MAHPSLWDLAADKQTLATEEPLEVARCTKIIDAGTDNAKYMIKKSYGKYVVDLGDKVGDVDVV